MAAIDAQFDAAIDATESQALPTPKRVFGRPFQPGNTARFGTKKDRGEEIRETIARKAAKGDMNAARLWLAYYAGMHDADKGISLSERLQAILSDHPRMLAELALDEKHVQEGIQ